jgi:hypothetical protein
MITDKVSSRLLSQIALRQAQIDTPAPDRLRTMQEMGMNTDNLQIQRIFIHLHQPLTLSQLDELNSMGVKVYTDTWIPPLGNYPTGYVIAEVPINTIAALTRKEYIVSLETAEGQLQPQKGAQPQ